PRYAGDAPRIENFNVDFFPTASQLIAAFNSGNIDGFGGLEPHDVVSIERPYETHAFSMPSYYAVFFNQTQNIALQDAGVRNALGTALDRSLVLRNVLNDSGEP